MVKWKKINLTQKSEKLQCIEVFLCLVTTIRVKAKSLQEF
jgi:hypothetical protein